MALKIPLAARGVEGWGEGGGGWGTYKNRDRPRMKAKSDDQPGLEREQRDVVSPLYPPLPLNPHPSPQAPPPTPGRSVQVSLHPCKKNLWLARDPENI